jgi:glutathionylspermidine synthase
MKGGIPFSAGEMLGPLRYRKLRLRTIFESFKWDPQVEDTSVLAPYPILLSKNAWKEVAVMAEHLAAETLAAENEILLRPELLKDLALPRAIWKLLAMGVQVVSAPRVMRFDFHYTRDGWRISEVNSDVPGGFVEAEGFTELMAEEYELSSTGQPAKRLAECLVRSGGEKPTIGLVHASAYSDDRQVMTYIAREMEKCGGHAVLLNPSQVRWEDQPGAGARVESEWFKGNMDTVYRFFPAEWLPNLKRTCAWQRYFVGNSIPQSNPGCAIISQTKRFGLMLDRLKTGMTKWKQLLPVTTDVRAVDCNSGEWMMKPALGRVGEAIGIQGITAAREWKRIRRNAFFYPRDWVAQRRFEIVPLQTGEGLRYVCLGVYTVDGTAAGIYGRCSASPIINHAAQDVAVLLKGD